MKKILHETFSKQSRGKTFYSMERTLQSVIATVINTKYSIPVAAHARPQFVRVGSHKARFFGAP